MSLLMTYFSVRLYNPQSALQCDIVLSLMMALV